MSYLGSWDMTMSTPMGPQDMRLDIISQDAAQFIGRVVSAMGNFDITGSVAGDALRWEMKAKKPMPITVTFDVQVFGDSMSGAAKLGFLGKSDVTGQRIAATAQMVVTADRDLDNIGPITGDSVDPRYEEPYIQVDEMRTDPVPHRYVNGGFKDSDARFSFYFPPPEQYQGRFFHNTYPMITNSDVGPFPIQFDVAEGDIGFTMASGAAYVQTNLGGTDRAPPADPAIAAYRVNAAAAKYCRVLAAEHYGEHRSYGYLFGGSGGSYQVMGSAENTQGVWDGFLPYVLGTPYAIPSMFTIRMHALRVLRQRNKFPAIMDALDPGGSGDPYAELNEEEAAALREATLLGYPPRGWWDHATLTSGYFYNVAPLIPMFDPSYLEDFWTKPGYLGSSDAAIQAARFQFETTIANTVMLDVTDRQHKHVVLATVPGRDMADAHLVVLSGRAAGKSIPIGTVDDKVLGFGFAANQAAINDLQPGDQVQVDNSWPLAFETYQRHQVPPTQDLYGWNQYRDADGQPIYPQREMLIGPVGASNTAGRIPDGRIKAKVLVIEALADVDALPWQADWYRAKVKEALGHEFADSFALWFIENAQHENPLTTIANANIVSFAGALQQGLRDLAAWVEKGERPSDTQYRVVDTQIVVPASSGERGGIQPVVELSVNGGQCATVAVGEQVHFAAVIEVPAGMGTVVSAEWDFAGIGTYPDHATIADPQAVVSLSPSHSYPKPGTYFPVLRVASHRGGDQLDAYGRVQNLARVRVVVS